MQRCGKIVSIHSHTFDLIVHSDLQCVSGVERSRTGDERTQHVTTPSVQAALVEGVVVDTSGASQLCAMLLRNPNTFRAVFAAIGDGNVPSCQDPCGQCSRFISKPAVLFTASLEIPANELDCHSRGSSFHDMVSTDSQEPSRDETKFQGDSGRVLLHVIIKPVVLGWVSASTRGGKLNGLRRTGRILKVVPFHSEHRIMERLFKLHSLGKSPIEKAA